MKVLIPSRALELKGEIKNCLTLANKQGFDTRSIEFGVSETQCFVINSSNFNTSICADFLCTSEQCLQNSNCDYIAIYAGNSSDSSWKNGASSSSNQASPIYIGISHEKCKYDVWSSPSGTRAVSRDDSFPSSFNKTHHFCWLLSAIALHYSIDDAIVLANAFSNVSRETWPVSIKDFPDVVTESESLSVHCPWLDGESAKEFKQVEKSFFAIYPIVDSIDWLERLLKFGVKTIQFRIKNYPVYQTEQLVKSAISLGNRYEAQLFINDHWQLAIKHNAFGVHLGQEDLTDVCLHQLSSNGLALGVSTHGYYEVLLALRLNPSYLAFGQVFKTVTKQVDSHPQGLTKLKLFQRLIDTTILNEVHSNIATVAIGGINLQNAELVSQCGVDSLAVIGAITNAKDTKVRSR